MPRPALRAQNPNGLGNLAFDILSQHLFVSNLEDGKLYSAEKEGNKNLYVMDMQGQLERTIKLSIDNPKGDYSLGQVKKCAALAIKHAPTELRPTSEDVIEENFKAENLKSYS